MSSILFALDNGIATITLNNPDRANVLDRQMAHSFLDVALRCESDASIRCVILTGNGRLFCGGGDIEAFAAEGEAVSEFMSNLAEVLHGAIRCLAQMPKPVIVLANGPVAGIGVSLAAIADYTLAADTAHFTAAYSVIGLTPDGGLSWTLPRLIGLRNAQRMLIGNERIDAAEAAAIGLITRAVPGEKLQSEGRALAQRLAAASTTALAGTRDLLLQSFQSNFDAHLEREARRVALAGASADSREGVAAFRERRKPNFQSAADGGDVPAMETYI